ncbi:MAG: hypothetical protein P8185_09355 [Deltaproteobacteria bacterium]|jgi:hypothetical protein
MQWKKKEKKVLEPVDMQTGIGMLQEQIERARQILNRRPIPAGDNQVWNEQTEEVLTRIYGPGSPNIDTIVGAVGDAPAWIFMPDDVTEQYEAACLENRIKLLEGCVVALKRKDRKSGIS